MFGIRFIKFQPGVYALKYKNGKAVKEGAGISFYYSVRKATLVGVPIGSADAPFIFTMVTSDFQTVTVQGQVTYRIADPKKIAALLDYTYDARGRDYASDDPSKLPQRIINSANVLTSRFVAGLSLRDALKSSEKLASSVSDGLKKLNEIGALGIEILGFSVLAVKPTPETSRALEAEAREQILKEADDAVYSRRNSSVEQERKIKENELNTEIAVENKKRQIRETQLDSERMVQQKQQEIQKSDLSFRIEQEDKNKQLVSLSVENERAKADAKAYAADAILKAFGKADPALIQSLATMGMQPQQLIALAFQGLADKAGKIGQLNITPELLTELLKNQK